MPDQPTVRVVTTDLTTGESETLDLAPGQYLVTCAEPAYVAQATHYDTHYDTGTVQLTIRQADQEEPQ